MRVLFVFLFALNILTISHLCFAGLAEVETAVIQEDFVTAGKLAEEAISTESDKDKKRELNYYLALSHLRLGHYPEARLMFEQLVHERLDSKQKDKVYLGLFDAYYLAEDYSGAYDISEKYLKKNSRSESLSTFYLKIARANLKLAKWNEARDYLNKILQKFPSSMEAQIAQQLLEEKQFFAVQVGAFIDRERAEQMVNDLKNKNEYAYIVETTDQQNRMFYRVRVGQLASLDEAQKLETRLSTLGYPTQIYP
jgi:tetratricopeptide (TPR) repeat protein